MRFKAKPYIYGKVYFIEFVRLNLGMIFLTSGLMKAGRDQKHLSEAKMCMKESTYGKNCLIKVSQQPQKPLSGIPSDSIFLKAN